MRVKMIAHDCKPFDPVIHAPEIRRVNPLFPQSRGVPPGIEVGRPLQEPKDVNAFAGVFNRPASDGFEGKRTDLDLNRNRHAVYVRAHVGAVGSKRTFQRDITDTGLLQKRLVNLHLAPPVCVTFVLGVSARKGIDVGEVIDHASAGFQNNRIAAIRTFERAVCF